MEEHTSEDDAMEAMDAASSAESSTDHSTTAVAAYTPVADDNISTTGPLGTLPNPQSQAQPQSRTVLSAAQADAVHQVRTVIAALESTIDNLKAVGVVRGVQCLETELHKERKRERDFARETPAVAEAFYEYVTQKQMKSNRRNSAKHK